MVYKLCSKCGKKIEQYKECECKIQAKRDSYNGYKRRRQDKDRQALYSSTTWIRLRDYIYSVIRRIILSSKSQII